MSKTHRRYFRTGRKTLRDGKAHGWNMTEPSWWNRLMHTKRRRVEARRVTARFMRDPGTADGLIWPLDRKPHWYFW